MKLNYPERQKLRLGLCHNTLTPAKHQGYMEVLLCIDAWGLQYLQPVIVQELCESRGGRPGLSVLTSLLVSVDVKIY